MVAAVDGVIIFAVRVAGYAEVLGSGTVFEAPSGEWLSSGDTGLTCPGSSFG